MGDPYGSRNINATKEIAAQLEALRETRPSARFAAQRSAKGLQTVAAILKAAREIFIRDGHAGLTMRIVAEEAGIALGNISYYFPTKRDLVEALLREELAGYAENHLKVFGAKQDAPLDILLDTIEFYVTNSRTSYGFFFQTWAYASSDDAARALVSELYRLIGQFLYRLVKAARPELDHAQITKSVLQISSLTQGIGLFMAIGPQDNPALQTAESDVREQVRRIVEMA